MIQKYIFEVESEHNISAWPDRKIQNFMEVIMINPEVYKRNAADNRILVLAEGLKMGAGFYQIEAINFFVRGLHQTMENAQTEEDARRSGKLPGWDAPRYGLQDSAYYPIVFGWEEC